MPPPLVAAVVAEEEVEEVVGVGEYQELEDHPVEEEEDHQVEEENHLEVQPFQEEDMVMKCAEAVKPYSHWTGADRQS